MEIVIFFYILDSSFYICKNKAGFLLTLKLYIFSDFLGYQSFGYD